MKSIVWHEVPQKIKEYCRIHGRLVTGTTVLLCLILYMGWKESVWSEVDTMESPSTVVTSSEKKGYRGTHKKMKTTVDTQEGDERIDVKGTSKLVYPIRPIIRGEPLQDMFTYSLEEEKRNSIELAEDIHHKNTGQVIQKEKKNKKELDGTKQKEIKKSDILLGTDGKEKHSKKELGHTIIRLLGIIRGNRQMAVLDVSGKVIQLSVGQSYEDIQLIEVGDHTVAIQERGQLRWVE